MIMTMVPYNTVICFKVKNIGVKYTAVRSVSASLAHPAPSHSSTNYTFTDVDVFKVAGLTSAPLAPAGSPPVLTPAALMPNFLCKGA